MIPISNLPKFSQLINGNLNADSLPWNVCPTWHFWTFGTWSQEPVLLITTLRWLCSPSLSIRNKQICAPTVILPSTLLGTNGNNWVWPSEIDSGTIISRLRNTNMNCSSWLHVRTSMTQKLRDLAKKSQLGYGRTKMQGQVWVPGPHVSSAEQKWSSDRCVQP